MFAASVLAAALCFDIPASQAYQDAPWCAVCQAAGRNGTANIARSKNADLMCLLAIVAGATRTRTLFPRRLRPGRSGNGTRSGIKLTGPHRHLMSAASGERLD